MNSLALKIFMTKEGSPMELSLTLAHDAAQVLKEVGDFQLKSFRGKQTVEAKGRNDLVTEVDKQSESLLFGKLSPLFPQAAFLGEEFGFREGSSDWCWVVDPIDGTTNFLHGLDMWSISVGLCYKNDPKLGVVYRPYTGDLYFASEGLGAYRNQTRLERLIPKDFSESLIGMGFPFKSDELYKPFFEASAHVLRGARDMRRCGSAALDLCFLASGVFGGFWECDLSPYDIAGAIPLLKEVGALMWDLHGNPYELGKGRFFIAGNPHLMDSFYQAVSPSYQGRLG
jgi:myo-inositol-1(or 4)-monophosphatase